MDIPSGEWEDWAQLKCEWKVSVGLLVRFDDGPLYVLNEDTVEVLLDYLRRERGEDSPRYDLSFSAN